MNKQQMKDKIKEEIESFNRRQLMKVLHYIENLR